MKRIPDPTSTSTPSASVRAWIASGDPRRDLPSWTRSLKSTEQMIVSRSVSVAELSGERLAEASRDAIVDALCELPGGPCRMWAFLPRPTDRDDDFIERYMRFNEGRTAAFRSLPEIVKSVPAGTCVGHAGSSLVIHVLWSPHFFSTLENPRQRPAWMYSTRFGPVPPAFVRGVVCNGAVFASGTAAIVGEETLHEDSIDLQFDETVQNMRALASVAHASGPWRSLQIYVRKECDLDRIAELAEQRFPGAVDRVLQAPLCRTTLLVEIEGVCDGVASNP